MNESQTTLRRMHRVPKRYRVMLCIASLIFAFPFIALRCFYLNAKDAARGWRFDMLQEWGSVKLMWRGEDEHTLDIPAFLRRGDHDA